MTYHRACCCQAPDEGFYCLPSGSDECSSSVTLTMNVPVATVRFLGDAGMDTTYAGYCESPSKAWSSSFSVFAHERMANPDYLQCYTGNQCCMCFYQGVNTRYFNNNPYTIPLITGSSVSSGSWFGDEVWEGNTCEIQNNPCAVTAPTNTCTSTTTCDCFSLNGGSMNNNACQTNGTCGMTRKAEYVNCHNIFYISKIKHFGYYYCGTSEQSCFMGCSHSCDNPCNPNSSAFSPSGCESLLGYSSGTLPTASWAYVFESQECYGYVPPLGGCSDCMEYAYTSYQGCIGTREYAKLWYSGADDRWYIYVGFDASRGRVKRDSHPIFGWNNSDNTYYIQTPIQEIPNTYENAFNSCNPYISAQGCFDCPHTFACLGCWSEAESCENCTSHASTCLQSGYTAVNGANELGSSWKLPAGWSPCDSSSGTITSSSDGVELACGAAKASGLGIPDGVGANARRYGMIGWVENGFELSWTLTP